MDVKAYPAEPPRGIFHFPQGVICLIKQEDTGKESVKITRLSGDEFEFEIIPKDLTRAERQDFPIRVCEYAKGLTEEELEALPEKELADHIKQKPKTTVKAERKVDIAREPKQVVKLADGEILKIGNTITYSAGTNIIALDDSVGAGDSWGTAYDMEDVLSACGAVVTKQGANAYDISARLHFLSGVYFVSESEFVELKPNPINPAYVFDIDSGAHVRFGTYDSANDYCYNGTFWRFYLASETGTRLDRNDGEWLIYGSNLWHDSIMFAKSWNFWGTTRIFDTEMEGTAYISGVDTNCQRMTWKGKNKAASYDILLASGYNFAWAGIKSMDSQKGLFMSSTTTSDIDIYDATLTDNAPYDYYESGNYLMRFINSSFDRAKVYVPSARKGLQECYTFNVKVTDDSGTPKVGATVELKDTDGTLVFSEQTVSGGVLASDQIVRVWWKGYDNLGGIKDYNPFTLKVISGSDETEYPITIDHQISKDVVLVPQSVASYDNIMEGINDIKGTGFVKDTHSAVNIAQQTNKLHFTGDDVKATLDNEAVTTDTASRNASKATGFATENPPSQNLADYKAIGFSTHDDPTSGIKGSPGKTIQEAFNNERGTNGAYTGTPPTVLEIQAGLATSAEVESIDALLDRVLGLGQENHYIDTAVFDDDDNMTTCRIRTYSAAGSVGTDSDVLATYEMTATYTDDNLATYKMVKI